MLENGGRYCATCRWWDEEFAQQQVAVGIPYRVSRCHKTPTLPERLDCDWCSKHSERHKEESE
jgi:hypothetical protein